MIYKIIDWICENLPDDHGTTYKPESFSFFHYDFHHTLHQRALAFIFYKKEKYPAFVIKYSKSNWYNSFLEDEFQKYKDLYFSLSDYLKETIPEPIHLFKEDNKVASIERGMPGTSLKNLILLSSSLKEVIQYLKKSCLWIKNLQEETKSPVKSNESQFRKLIYDPVKLFIDRYQISHKQKKVLTSVLEEIFDTFQEPWFFVTSHGDFWFNNIILANESIGVVDWTFLQKEYLPFWDFYTLLFNANLNSVKNGRHSKKEIELFTNDLNELKNEYLQEIGICVDMEQKVHLLFITTRSVWNELHAGYNSTWDSIWKKRYDEQIEHFL